MESGHAEGARSGSGPVGSGGLAALNRGGGGPRAHFRLATAALRPLPSLLIIGAQKAGTRSLRAYLTAHPGVTGPTAEVHYFDQPALPSVWWYRSHFPRRRLRAAHPLVIETTPAYLFSPMAPGRIRATIPDARLIAILRDPVERAFSHYRHAVKLGRESRSFMQALLDEQRHATAAATDRERGASPSGPRTSYAARGRYADQLSRYLDRFERRQLLVLCFEDIFAGSASELDRLHDFVGLRQTPGLTVRHLHRGQGSGTPVPPEARDYLEEYYREPNEQLETLLGRAFWPR
jgi:hypothetical protein